MRVTQSMIANSSLRNISNSYSKIAKLDEQIATGKKFTKPSDNPVSAMRAMGYRTDLNRIGQYQANISEVRNWVDSTDDALDNVNSALQKIRELTVQASNGSLEENQRKYIAEEITQLREQIVSIADTQVGGKYIFGGTKTDQKPSENISGATEEIKLEVFSGIELPLNVPGKNVFESLISEDGPLKKLINDLNNAAVSEETIGSHLSVIDAEIDKILNSRATIGARQNRVDLMESRLDSQEVSSTRILSDNEDIDLERAIMDLTIQESVHRAALAVGAKVIQPTLMDFLR